MTAEPVAQGKPTSLATRSRLRLQHVFGTAFVCGPILAAIAPLGLAPLFTVVTLAALALHLRDHRAWPWPRRGMIAIGLAFVVWLALSAFWTIALPETLRFLPRGILYVVMGLALVVVAQRLPVEERRVTDLCLVSGIVVGAALFAIEIASDGSIAAAFHRLVKGEARVFEAGSLNRGATVFAMLAFPAAISARRQFGWPVAAVILVLVLVLTVPVQGAKAAVAAGIGIIVFAIVVALGRRAITFLAVAVVLVVAVAPLQSAILAAVPGPWTTSDAPSVTHRLIIWRFVAEHVSERPLLGWGLNAARAMPGGKEGPQEGTEHLPLHPHSVPLHLWLELGAIGALLAAAGTAGAILALRRMFCNLPDLGLAAATAAAAVSAAAVGYGAWQGWWITALWLVCATLAAVAPAPDHRTSSQ